MILRDYQQRAVDDTLEALKENQSALIVFPTGTGKTVVFSHLIKQFRPDQRVLLLAHREELIRQAASKIEAITGETPDIEMADEYADRGGIFDTRARVVVSSIQTQQGRMTRFKPRDFGLIITDEAHHATAVSYRKVYDYFIGANPEIKHIGVTATPDRADEEALGQIFDVVSANYEIIDAILDGWLVRVVCKQVIIHDLDLSKVRTTAGDLNQGDLDEVMQAEGPLQGVADATMKEAGSRKTLVFATTLRHAELLAEILNRHKIASARWISGTTRKDVRAQTLKDYTNGAFQYLVNVGVFTEGFDEPGIECIVMARPTKSRALYAQMCLDAETEILTDRGWRDIGHDIDVDERAAAFDLTDGSVRWSPILNYVRRYKLDEETFYAALNPHLDIRVTDRHKMVVRQRVGRARQRTAWQLKDARNVVNIRDIVEIPLCGNQKAPGVPLADDDLRFIGLWMTDGNLNPTNGAVTLYQSERYPEAIEYIERVLAGCGFKHGHRVETSPTNYGERRNPLHRWTISKGKPRGRDKDKTGWGRLAPFMDKELPDTLEGMTREQLLVLLEAMNIGDGTKQRTRTWNCHTMSICTKRRRLADRLQSLCVRRGIRCNIGVGGTDRSMLMLHISADRPVWSLATTRRDRPDFGPDGTTREVVWCIEVETGAIITRRRGKVAVVGNCGRGTRPLPGIVDGLATAQERREAIKASAKPNVEIIDFAGNTGRHKLITAADILAGKHSDDVVGRAAKKSGSGKAIDVIDAMDESAAEIRAEHEAERNAEMEKRRKMLARAVYETRTVDPFDALGIEPEREYGWDKRRKATPAMQCMLRRNGIGTDGLSFGKAKQIITEIKKREQQGLCGYVQALRLNQAGFDSNVTPQKAAMILREIAASKQRQQEAVK